MKVTTKGKMKTSRREIENQKEERSLVVDDQIIKNNILDSRELLFLRKDNVAYFVNTDGKPLDSGSQKLFERNEIPNLGSLALGKAKAIKYKKHYHMALPICEGQREGPTTILNQNYNSNKRFANHR